MFTRPQALFTPLTLLLTLAACTDRETDDPDSLGTTTGSTSNTGATSSTFDSSSEQTSSISGTDSSGSATDSSSDGSGTTQVPSCDDLPVGQWEVVSTSGAPSLRVNASAVWTGTEVIVFGGITPGQPQLGPLNDGAAYNPQSKTWRPIAVPSIQPRMDHAAVWTGDKMVMWGGCNEEGDCQGPFRQGAAYDPKTDTWTLLPTDNMPVGRAGHLGVLAGSEIVFWGGSIFDGEGAIQLGGRFDLATNTWLTLTSEGEPTMRHNHTLVWTGSRAIVWGGYDETSTINEDAKTGGRVALDGTPWQPTALSGAPRGRLDHVATFIDNAMLIWGGVAGETALNDGAAYDPVADQWSVLPTVDLTPRARAAAAVVGHRWVIWGGSTATEVFGDGAAYLPSAACWEKLSTNGAPSPRGEALVVPIDGGVFIWGGDDAAGTRQDGAILRVP